MIALKLTELSNTIVIYICFRLPCIVDRLEGFVMLWKRGKDIITVASQIIDKVQTGDLIQSHKRSDVPSAL